MIMKFGSRKTNLQTGSAVKSNDPVNSRIFQKLFSEVESLKQEIDILKTEIEILKTDIETNKTDIETNHP